MSYCRWSTDDFSCDLYCYGNASGGWTTHVAGNKPVGEIPKVTASFDQPDEMARQMNAQHEWLASCAREPLGLPHDGETFNDPTLEAFRDRLMTLRAAGYRFPDYVLTEVEAEIMEARYGC